MGACAHRRVTIDIHGAIDEVIVIPSFYCSDGPIGERSVCKLAREEAAKRDIVLGKVSARWKTDQWEVGAQAMETVK